MNIKLRIYNKNSLGPHVDCFFVDVKWSKAITAAGHLIPETFQINELQAYYIQNRPSMQGF